MRRRLDIAASLIVTPGVLFLDEPTTGLDPNARQGVWRMIRDLARVGRHHPADDAVSRGGRPARRPHRRDRPWPEDRRRHEPRAEGGDRLGLPPCRARRSGTARRGRAAARSSASGSRSSAAPEGASSRSWPAAPRQASEALAALIADGIELADFSMGNPSLDEVFFALTGSRASTERRRRP